MAEEIRQVLNDPVKLREATKAAFDLVDVNKNGSIDRNELRAALDELATGFGLPVVSDEDLNEGLAKLDTDQSGTLEVAEFEVLVKELLEGLAEALSG